MVAIKKVAFILSTGKVCISLPNCSQVYGLYCPL